MGKKRPGARKEGDRAKQARIERGQDRKGWYDTHDNKDAFYNAKFEAYYRGHVVKEEDWQPFLDTMKAHLPISFRLSTIAGRHNYILDTLKGDCFGLPKEPEMHKIDDEEVAVQAPKPLPWYTPYGHAWQIALGKRGLKKIAALRKFRQFLMREDKQGNITRQEAVSMIPPQLLGVEPHHIVLDMCAAPGSKTAQLLEDLHKGGNSEVPSGIVIANDADPDRAYMLVHQLKRLGSPAFLVTTHSGQFFPNLYLPKDSKHASTELAYKEDRFTSKITKMEANFTSTNTPQVDLASYSVPNTAVSSAPVAPAPLLFDRILCDVPCSGDGTMRKCPNIWRNWGVGSGQGLHPLQLSIAWRAAQMLKVGGRMVYSTCSLNPIENEAVVAELIRRSRGALRIVDVAEKLPGLIREPGMHTWKVLLEGSDFTKDAEGAAAYAAKLAEKGVTEETKGFLPKAVMHEMDSLREINNLGFMKRKKLRTSFFPPNMLEQFSKDTQALWDENAAADNGRNMENDAFGPQSSTYSYLPTAAEMNLERCVRILPHRQDTGGFFITLLEKVDVLPTWEKINEERKEKEEKEKKEKAANAAAATEAATPTAETAVETGDAAPVVQGDAVEAPADAETVGVKPVDFRETHEKEFKNKPQQKQWNDFPFVNLNPVLCQALQKEFALDRSKGYSEKNYFSRSDNLTGSGKKVYFLSDTIADLVNTPQNFRLKIVHSGLKVFEATGSAYEKARKKNAKAENVPIEAAIVAKDDIPNFRLTQDALTFILPYIGKQVLHVSKEDYTLLLKDKNGVKIDSFSEPLKKLLQYIPDFDKADNKEKDDNVTYVDGVVNSSKIYLGSCVIRVAGDQLPVGVMSNQILSAAWRTGSSLNLMIDLAERESLLNLFDPKDDEEEMDTKEDGNEERPTEE